MHSRIGIIHNPRSADSASLIRKSIQVALDVLDRHTAKLFITKLLKPSNIQQINNGEKNVLDFAISVSMLFYLYNFSYCEYQSTKEYLLLFISAEKLLL